MWDTFNLGRSSRTSDDTEDGLPTSPRATSSHGQKRRGRRRRLSSTASVESNASESSSRALEDFKVNYLDMVVTLTSRGGTMFCDDGGGSGLHIGQVARAELSHFQVCQFAAQRGTNQYSFVSVANGGFVTATMFGNEMRNDISLILLQETKLPPCLYRYIVEYAIPNTTARTDEVDGFNYTPLTCPPRPASAVKPRPNMHQTFELESPQVEKYAFKTPWDTYVRALMWDGSVSQSDSCFAEEMWVIKRKKR